MSLSEEQLMLLEQITYISEVEDKVEGNMGTTVTLGDMLAGFTEEELSKLKKSETEFTSVEEWAAIIRQIQSDPELSSLKYVGYDSNVFATCFEDSDGNAVVAFRGTADGYEWYDDVCGLNAADTPSQEDALNYIESLGYDHITVVGHSKGGNKAQYVAITSDKVDKCISMDGQGFSQEFYDKYSAEISVNSSKITNYSLSTDYVHILLFSVGDQVYCQGDPSKAGAANHSPSGYFQYKKYYDELGNEHVRLELNSQGNVNLLKTSENSSLTYLHEFTCFVINNMPDEDKDRAVVYIGNILAMWRSNDDTPYSVTVNGVTYTKDNLMDYIMSDQDTMALIAAYVIKYAETNNLTYEEFYQLAVAFGFTKLLGMLCAGLTISMDANPIGTAAGVLTADGILRLIYANITDGDNDPIIEALLERIDESLDIDISVKELWQDIETEYSQIEVTDTSNAMSTPQVSQGRRLDYSEKVYQALMESISYIQSQTMDSLNSWSSYSGENWYSSLNTSLALKGIKTYYARMKEITENCKSQIRGIFDNVSDIDTSHGESITTETFECKLEVNTIKTMTAAISD